MRLRIGIIGTGGIAAEFADHDVAQAHRFHPQTHHLLELVRGGAVGRVRRTLDRWRAAAGVHYGDLEG